MFVLSEILVLVAIGWLVSRMFQRMNPDRRNSIEQPAQPPPLHPGQPVQRSVTEEIGGREQASARPNPPAALTRDEQMAELRRRYVADEITVEEYEAELDKLLKS
jgi:hypothetical protein